MNVFEVFTLTRRYELFKAPVWSGGNLVSPSSKSLVLTFKPIRNDRLLWSSSSRCRDSLNSDTSFTAENTLNMKENQIERINTADQERLILKVHL